MEPQALVTTTLPGLEIWNKVNAGWSKLHTAASLAPGVDCQLRTSGHLDFAAFQAPGVAIFSLTNGGPQWVFPNPQGAVQIVAKDWRNDSFVDVPSIATHFAIAGQNRLHPLTPQNELKLTNDGYTLRLQNDKTVYAEGFIPFGMGFVEGTGLLLCTETKRSGQAEIYVPFHHLLSLPAKSTRLFSAPPVLKYAPLSQGIIAGHVWEVSRLGESLEFSLRLQQENFTITYNQRQGVLLQRPGFLYSLGNSKVKIEHITVVDAVDGLVVNEAAVPSWTQQGNAIVAKCGEYCHPVELRRLPMSDGYVAVCSTRIATQVRSGEVFECLIVAEPEEVSVADVLKLVTHTTLSDSEFPQSPIA